MTTQRETAPSQGVLRRLAIAVGRSIVSILIIGLIAIGAFALRQGYFHFAEIRQIASQNSALFGGIFCALVLWNYWYRRPERTG
jgi:hypothetical protein